eukprot:jgi/Botrbrau1/14709/Bobra.0108s0059.1
MEPSKLAGEVQGSSAANGWKSLKAASGSTRDARKWDLRKDWGSCHVVCQVANMGKGLPSVLSLIIAHPFDQVPPRLSNSLFSNDGLNFINAATLICIQRRW